MLTIRDLSHAYGSLRVLQNFQIDVTAGEIVCILGPSGCGKTTLLRLIAGLESVQSGSIEIDGVSIVDTPIHLRQFGLMFQDYALFPHMDVKDNILFGTRMKRKTKDEELSTLTRMMNLVGLSGLENRQIDELSGGQRQRVALARSLAPAPRLLMLDEPLGSLDAVLKRQLAIELRTIIKQTGTTTLYVTHDQNEAFSIADRIVVMQAGSIEQIDTPKSLYLQPATEFVAGFLELENIFAITGTAGSWVDTPAGRFPITTESATASHVLIHPDSLSIGPAPCPSTNLRSIKATIETAVYVGDKFRAWVRLHENDAVRLLVKVSVTAPHPEPGTTIWVCLDPYNVIYLKERVPQEKH